MSPPFPVVLAPVLNVIVPVDPDVATPVATVTPPDTPAALGVVAELLIVTEPLVVVEPPLVIVILPPKAAAVVFPL
jgi:hypothetical protein